MRSWQPELSSGSGCSSIPARCSHLAIAQCGDGIVGTVHVIAGPVVPAATITGTNAATGIVGSGCTNGKGEYELPELRVGQYKVQVSKPGLGTKGVFEELRHVEPGIHRRRLRPHQSDNAAHGPDRIAGCG